MALYSDFTRTGDLRRPGFFDTIRARFAEAREIGRVRAELSQMSDRDLADIGIARGEIRHIAAQASVLR